MLFARCLFEPTEGLGRWFFDIFELQRIKRDQHSDVYIHINTDFTLLPKINALSTIFELQQLQTNE